MKTAIHKITSKHLGQDYEFKVYGESGKPLMVFPCSNGRYFDYENFGMIDVLRPFIEAGDIRVVTVDSRDSESWFHPQKTVDMGARHRQFELCITEEIPAFMNKTYGVDETWMATGNSWGGYHALNFCLKFPQVFDVCISLSGAYSLRHGIGSYFDQTVYYNDMLMYLPNLNEKPTVEPLRDSYFIICHGKGAWEQCQDEATAVVRQLYRLKLTCWYDVWDERYPHDWQSWKEQIVKFMNALRDGVIFPNAPGGMVKFIGGYRRKRTIKTT